MLDMTADNLPQAGATPRRGPNEALPALMLGAIGVV